MPTPTPIGQPAESSQTYESKNIIRWLIAGVVFTNLVALIYAGLNLHRSWLDTLAAAEIRSQTIASAVEQSIASDIEKIDISLQTVVNGIEAEYAHGQPKLSGLSLTLAQQVRMLPKVSGFRVMDAHGSLVVGNGVDSDAGLNVSEREYFQKLRDGEVSGLYISKPIFSQVSHRWIIPFVRRYQDRAGNFKGVVSVPIPVENFNQHLQHFTADTTDAISLRYLDLSLIARYPTVDSSGLKMEVGSNNISAAMRQLAASGVKDRTYRTLAPYDQTQRVNTYRRVDNAPFVIIAGVGQAAFQQAWYRELWRTIAFLIGFAAVNGLLARFVFRYWREQAKALRSVIKGHRELQAAVATITERDQALDRAQEAGKLGTYTFDVSSGEFIGSTTFNALLGLHEDVAVTQSLWVDLIHPDDRQEAINHLDRHIQEQRPSFSNEYRIVRKRDGKVRWIYNLANLDYKPDGSLARISGVIQDINDRKAAEDRLLLTHQAFQHSVEGIFITDSQGFILEVNPAFTLISGYQPEEAIGKKPSLLKSGRHTDATYQDLWQKLIESGSWEGELTNRRKDGSFFIQLTQISSVRDSKGNVSRYICLASDVTELRDTQSRIEHMAYFDKLTELPNRALLFDRLETALRQTERHHEFLAVCYLDLDGFKSINDEWGHDTGDRFLIETGRRIQSCVREGDTVSRIGGDEFIVLLTRMRDVIEIEQAVQRMLMAVAEPITFDEVCRTLTISVGVTVYPNSAINDADGLIRQADQAMYIAKRTGKNRMHLFDAESDRRLRDHQDFFSRVLTAFDQHEFCLHYQPKVDMRSGKIMGAEALIRWNHPDQGILLPGVFLPVIENKEFSIRLGEWVVREALKQMRAWAARGFVLPLSVNISGYQLQRSDFAARLAAQLAEFPEIPPAWLELEILETIAMEDIEKTNAIINDCLQLGVRFALDDFGTGYSSLTYFRRLPVETIKIDRSFVIDMIRDPTDHALVEAIVGLANSMRRRVIAEGVETIEHEVQLLQLGCDLAQGYGIARPMPAEQVQPWAAKWTIPEAWGKAVS